MPDHFSRQEAWLEAELVRARSLGVRHIMVFQVSCCRAGHQIVRHCPSTSPGSCPTPLKVRCVRR